MDRFDEDRPFHFWLRGIIINAAIDRHRKYFRQPVLLELTDLHESATVDTGLLTDTQTDMLPILQQLTPAYRTVFNLFVMEGYKHREIAEQLGIKEATSRWHLLNAKKELKELLKNYLV